MSRTTTPGTTTRTNRTTARSPKNRRSGRTWLAFALPLSVACTGQLAGGEDEGSSNSPGEGSGGNGTSNPGMPGVTEECKPRIPQDLLLLGELPFVNSLRSLFGAEAVEGRLAPDPATKPFSQKGVVANTSLVSARLDWATHVTSSLAGKAAEFTACDGTEPQCVRGFLERFAHRAFRRPVGSEEIDGLVAVYELGAETSFDDGIQLALQAVLVSPSFNHRTEYGAPAADGSYTLTSHEFASTLSFLLTDGPPDEDLLSSADSGALDSPEERKEQALRLLALDSTKDSVESTLLAAWTLGNIFGKVKDENAYPNFTASLPSQMYEETRLFLREHLWQGGLSSVLTSRKTFVNAALADIYGIPFPGTDPNDFVPVELPPERRGLLTQASVLTSLSRTDETSVVARGLFVNGPLLCLPKILSPPEAVIAEVEAQLTTDSTERERAEFRATTSPCKNCHDHFDAYGLLFETYDAIGQHRTTEGGQPIDPSVDLSKMRNFDGTFENAVAFAEELAKRPDFVECVTRHLVAYGTGEDGIKRTDCELTSVTSQLTNESTLGDVVAAVVASPALFTRISENAP